MSAAILSVAVSIGLAAVAWIYRSILILLVHGDTSGFLTERTISSRVAIVVGALLIIALVLLVSFLPQLQGKDHAQFTLSVAYFLTPAIGAILSGILLLFTSLIMRKSPRRLFLHWLAVFVLGASTIVLGVVLYLYLRGVGTAEPPAVYASLLAFGEAILFVAIAFLVPWRKSTIDRVTSEIVLSFRTGDNMSIRGYILTDGTSGPFVVHSVVDSTRFVVPREAVNYIKVSSLRATYSQRPVENLLSGRDD